MLALDERPFVEPAFRVIPDYVTTLGAEVADLSAAFGFVPDREQELWLDGAFGLRSDGLPAAREGTIIAGRQTVKSSSLEMTAFGWLFLTKEKLILWSAHEVPTSVETYLHMRELIEAKPWAMKLVQRFYDSPGSLRIQMRDGRRMLFVARTTAAGRGKSGAKRINDEGLELQPEHLGAQAAISSTFPWAQSFTGSSGAKASSVVLHEQITRGRAGDLPLYLEWSTDPAKGACQLGVECSHVRGTPGCRLDDRGLIRLANPTVGRIRPDGRGLTYEAIEQERKEQPDPLIHARERLGWHQAPAAAAAQVFSEDAWSDRRDVESRIVERRILSLHVSPNQDWSAVVAGGINADGLVHLEVPSKWADLQRTARTYTRWSGTDRVVPWLRKYLRKRRGDVTVLVLLAGSAAMSLLPALTRLADDPKLGELSIAIVPEVQMPAACGHLQNLVANEGVVHVGDPELQASVLAVAKRMVGEKSFVWSPRASSGDITAANAATLVAWRLEQGEDYDPEESVG